jgi:hypothetical protein
VSLAWTTLGALALLLPGIAFFGGLYSSDRFPREFGRNNPFIDVGLSIFAAALIHFLVLILALLAAAQIKGFSLAGGLRFALETLSEPSGDYEGLIRLIAGGMAYLVATPILAFGVGRVAATPVFSWLLRNMARHQWIRDLTDTQRRTREYNKAFVVTTLGDDHHAVMYEGFLKEFYFTKEGRVAYLVLTNAARFQLKIGANGAVTDNRSARIPVPGEGRASATRNGGYSPLLVIEGNSIHNVVFESVGDVSVRPGSTQTLDAAVTRRTGSAA